jgi:pSer/pThr/pTyr-binding forkhead associated (FHA) protein
MIVCSNCLHHNLDEASYCEACGSKLPELSSCSNCGSSVLDKAHFCGNCGFNLQLSAFKRVEPISAKETGSDLILPVPLPPEPVAQLNPPVSETAKTDTPESFEVEASLVPEHASAENDALQDGDASGEVINTKIQTQSATLLHAQSNTLISLAEDQTSIHIGKPNDRVPPDINVSVFSSAEVVSRVHAAIHIEGGHFFVEDVGSANGTYLNNMPLTPSTRYRLRVGDRITLGKGELMTFIFKMN